MEDLIAHLISTSPDIKPQKYAKGDILQREGGKAHKSYYVKKGLLRSYTIDEKGKEHNFMFASEGWLISDIESIEFDDDALLFIDCIEDSEIIELDRKNINTDSFTSVNYEKMITPLFRRIAVMQRRIILMMSAPAKDRYEYFLDVYPELPNRVPQKMIASYLGITPEALSKIKSKLLKK